MFLRSLWRNSLTHRWSPTLFVLSAPQEGITLGSDLEYFLKPPSIEPRETWVIRVSNGCMILHRVGVKDELLRMYTYYCTVVGTVIDKHCTPALGSWSVSSRLEAFFTGPEKRNRVDLKKKLNIAMELDS